MYAPYVHLSKGIRVKYMPISGLFLESRASEICIKRIHANQGVGVPCNFVLGNACTGCQIIMHYILYLVKM